MVHHSFNNHSLFVIYTRARHCVRCWGHSRKTQCLPTRRLKPRRRQKEEGAGVHSEGHLRAGAERRGGRYWSEEVSEGGHLPAHVCPQDSACSTTTFSVSGLGVWSALCHSPKLPGPSQATVICVQQVAQALPGHRTPGPALTVSCVTSSSSSHSPLPLFLQKHGPLTPGCPQQAKVGGQAPRASPPTSAAQARWRHSL